MPEDYDYIPFDDEENGEDDDGKMKIVIPTNDGNIMMELDPIGNTTYAKCNCPICKEGRLKVVGKREATKNVPDIYISTCQLCRSQIGFSSDEDMFFPLQEE